jgi:hypothetical protein
MAAALLSFSRGIKKGRQEIEDRLSLAAIKGQRGRKKERKKDGAKSVLFRATFQWMCL